MWALLSCQGSRADRAGSRAAYSQITATSTDITISLFTQYLTYFGHLDYVVRMDTQKFVGVSDMVDMACRAHGVSRIGIPKKDRETFERYIRRYLAELGLSKPYKVTQELAEGIVAHDLRAYFLEKFSSDSRALAHAQEANADAAASLRTEYDYRVNEADQQEPDHTSHANAFEISEQRFNSTMIRALVREVFPDFDEARFRHDYGLRESLKQPLQMASEHSEKSQRMRGDAMHHEELSRRLDPALDKGDLTSYLKGGGNNGAA